MMGGMRGARSDMLSRRVLTGCVAKERRIPRLIECDPVTHEVAELDGHEPRVVAEAFGGVPVQPSAEVLEGERQIPVVQRVAYGVMPRSSKASARRR